MRQGGTLGERQISNWETEVRMVKMGEEELYSGVYCLKSLILIILPLRDESQWMKCFRDQNREKEED